MPSRPSTSMGTGKSTSRNAQTSSNARGALCCLDAKINDDAEGVVGDWFGLKCAATPVASRSEERARRRNVGARRMATLQEENNNMGIVVVERTKQTAGPQIARSLYTMGSGRRMLECMSAQCGAEPVAFVNNRYNRKPVLDRDKHRTHMPDGAAALNAAA